MFGKEVTDVAKQMSPKMRRFADEYLICANATEAAIAAGYSKKYAGQNAGKLLKNPNVSKYLETQMEKISSDKLMDAEEVLATLAIIARGEVPETSVVVVKHPTKVEVMGAKETYEKIVSDEEAQVVESPTKNSDRNRALELIGKRHKLWTDKVEAKVEPVTFVDDVPDDDDDG